MGNKESRIHSPLGIEDELRIILIGKTGSGKSATGNSILQKNTFVSESGSSSCTRNCRRGENIYDKGKKKYNFIVVDTPGLYDTGISNDEVTKEIVKCIGLTSPGPHAIIYVVSLAVRFTQEEEETALHFINMFGDQLTDFMVIIFTHGDSMKKEDTVEKRIASGPQSLRDLVKRCGNRYVVFNNNLSPNDKKKKQQKSFMEMVEKMIETNDNSFYTDKMFKAAEKVIQNQIEKMIETNDKSFYTDEMFKEAEAVVKNKIEKKIEDETMQAYDARQAVRQDVEKGGSMLSFIGKGISALGQGVVTVVLEPTGVPRLVKGLAGLFEKEDKTQNK